VVPYYRVLRDELEPVFFKDTIALVGAYALSLHDLYPTPFGAGQPTAGVEVQANFVETLAANAPILPISAWTQALLFGFLVAFTIIGAVYLKPLRAFGLIMRLGGLYVSLAFVGFAHAQLWLPLVLPLSGMMRPSTRRQGIAEHRCTPRLRVDAFPSRSHLHAVCHAKRIEIKADDPYAWRHSSTMKLIA
jgi:CHASE2 domain